MLKEITIDGIEYLMLPKEAINKTSKDLGIILIRKKYCTFKRLGNDEYNHVFIPSCSEEHGILNAKSFIFCPYCGNNIIYG